jgi:hypothetical protein
VRLRAGLAGGDPTGEVAVAWQGKELLRTVYAASDLAHARAALERFYRWSDGVGVAELSRLARTVRAWEAEILAFHSTKGLLQRADRGREAAHQAGEAGRARLPQLRQLPPTAAAPLRGGMADSPDRKTARAPSTLGGVEPDYGSSVEREANAVHMLCSHRCW